MGVFSVKKRLWDFARLQISLPLSFGLTCVVATFLPAIGAYHFHGMTPAGHPGIAITFTDRAAAPLLWLRQTELQAVMPDFTELRLISFPSWHAAAAVIFMLSAWSVPVLRWLGLVLNVLMLAATPVQGAHYISDMIVGAGIGGLPSRSAPGPSKVLPPAWRGVRSRTTSTSGPSGVIGEPGSSRQALRATTHRSSSAPAGSPPPVPGTRSCGPGPDCNRGRSCGSGSHGKGRAR